MPVEAIARALKADSSSSVVGAFVGCPPVTSYVESASGVAAGGRTGPGLRIVAFIPSNANNTSVIVALGCNDKGAWSSCREALEAALARR